MVTLNNSERSKHTKKNKSLKGPNSGLPTVGIQKIKSALRQTKRLLAKDNLAADVRIETERRLKSLEIDLAKAEQSQKERQYALKYHKVKFFDRRKVCRKINQVKRELGSTSIDPARVAELRELLLSLRVDLNYILHYPKLRKYISLFPSSESSNTGETDTHREELRRQTRLAMQKGEMDLEPELRTDQEHKSQEPRSISDVPKRNDKQKRDQHNNQVRLRGLSDDGFFETSDNEDN